MSSHRTIQDIAGIEQLLPYLAPDYWDGHTIGQGELSPPAMNVTGRREKKLARSALVSYLDDPASAPPLQIYAAGEIFDPNEHEPGTVVAFRRETLTRTGAALLMPATMKTKNFANATIRTSIPNTKDFRSARVSLEDTEGIMSYESTAMWGVVTPKRKSDERRLTVIHPMFVFPGRRRTKIFSSSAVAYGDPITVGGVRHRASTDFERIESIRQLEVRSREQVQEQGPKFSIFSLFRRGQQ